MRSAPFQPVLGVAVCAALAAPAVGQTTWYVDDDTCPAPGSGTLNDPFCSVQAAIGAASDGDTIEVLPGTYVESINTQGKAITLRSTNPRDPAIVAATVLDGAGQDRVITVAAGERPDTVIEGLTIANGDADVGGGIGIVSSSPTIRSCVFRDNSANQGGGAYLMVSSSLFDQCTFENNAAGDGGGAFVYATTWPRFDRCTFINNSAVSEGGGVGADFANVRLARCLLANNSAGAGGAYGGAFSDPYVVSSLVRDNTAGRGGAFYLYDDNVKLIGSTVVRNVATTNGGGAIWGIESQPLIRNTILRGNTPDQFAGFVNPTAEYSNVEGGLSGPGVIDADPLFVDPAGDDFRLQPGSPSVNTGWNNWVPSYSHFDLDGDARISDGGTDMGAYEIEVPGPPQPTPQGELAAVLKDDGSLAYGLPQPLMLYNMDQGTWSELVRSLPAFAIAADPAEQCFWVQTGDTGLLAKVPYNTLRLEEVGVLTYAGRNSLSLSGMAVRNGTLYATVAYGMGGAPPQPKGLYEIDKARATVALVAEFPAEFEVWDLHYDPAGDRMLVLSNDGSIPATAQGIYEVDLATGQPTPVQEWMNYDPFTQAPGLQGLAVGGGRHFFFRSLYNDLQVYDANTLQQIESLSLPTQSFGPGWVLGGLTWAPSFSGMMGDMNGDSAVNAADIDAFVMALTDADGFRSSYPAGDMMRGDVNCDGIMNAADIDVFVGCVVSGGCGGCGQ